MKIIHLVMQIYSNARTVVDKLVTNSKFNVFGCLLNVL